jgi:hypothetical protein
MKREKAAQKEKQKKENGLHEKNHSLL